MSLLRTTANIVVGTFAVIGVACVGAYAYGKYSDNEESPEKGTPEATEETSASEE